MKHMLPIEKFTSWPRKIFNFLRGVRFHTKRILYYFIALVFVVLLSTLIVQIALASTNINSGVSAHWAWSDLVGWIDFYNTNSITVSSQHLTGYASSSIGDISLDCHTTRNGNICAPPEGPGNSTYQVTNDGSGDLSGWGWNDVYGWISFDCHNNGGCGSSAYEVLVNGATGDFSNYAWNDALGWISFNCADSSCSGSAGNWNVNTAWRLAAASGTLDSATFDTGIVGGAQINSVIWQGVLNGGAVDFQFATANAPNGPWNFIGSDGTANTYYGPTLPNVPVSLDYSFHNNARYFRYRVILYSDQAQTSSPRVDEISVNWSR